MKKITAFLLTCLVALASFNAMAVNTSDYVIDEGTLTGDVNNDDKVNVSDVTALVNMILGVIPKDEARADINGDGKVNVSDVTALINIILGVSSGGSTGGTKFEMQEWFENSAQLSYIPMHEWTDGDVIFLAIDPVSNEVCQNVYAIERVGGKWVFRDVNGSNKVGFKTSGGTFSAVYVQNANLAESYYNYIPITRDVACVDHSGTYTVTPKNGKYYITLSDLYFYHFVSRIDVSNAYEGDYFYESVTHLDALTKVSWMPTFGYGAFEKSNRAPVIDIDSNHKGHAYGVWQKGTRTDGWLTLNYAKNNGYAYYWDYGQTALIQGRYLTSIYSPWQNGWSRDLSMRYYNSDDRTSYRLNAGSTYQNVNINVGTDIIFRPYDGNTSDSYGTMTSVSSSNSGILEISYDNTQVNVTAHKVGSTTLTIKFKTKDNINCTYTYEVKVAPTLWVAGSDANNKPILWRNWQDKSMYLSGRENYTEATNIKVHGNSATVMMRKDVISPKTFYGTTTSGQTYDYIRYYFTGTSASIVKTSSAHGGGYYNQYTSGITGAHHLIDQYEPIYGVPRMWTDKSGNVYYTSAVRTTSSDVVGENTGSEVNTTIYKNKTAILTVPNFAVSDIAVSESTGKIYVVGYSSNVKKIVSKLIVINGNSVSTYDASSSAQSYYLAFTRLYLDQSTETAYIEYMAGNYGTINGNYHTCIYRYTASTGLQAYTNVNTYCTNHYPFLNNSLTLASEVVEHIKQYPFVFYGDKFYFLNYRATGGYDQSSSIRYYQLGASEIGDYTGLNYHTDSPITFDIKNGQIGVLYRDKNDGKYYPMTCELNTYRGGTPLENSTNATFYDVFLQTSLDE
ncbi:MAG: dockerin type I repeat-containing protein [Muribaculaceae bacterium]|nr:dockerin type I repeat-containing protein [Muribaculaceae bacterium]